MSLPTLSNSDCVILLTLEMNDIFEKFGYYIDPKYTGYNIPEQIWRKILTEFETREMPKQHQQLYFAMIKQKGTVKLQLEVPYDCQ